MLRLGLAGKPEMRQLPGRAPARLTPGRRAECNEALEKKGHKRGAVSQECPESRGSKSVARQRGLRLTASGAGRLCDEQNFVRSAALGCIKVPSGAGKTEILVSCLCASEA